MNDLHRPGEPESSAGAATGAPERDPRLRRIGLVVGALLALALLAWLLTPKATKAPGGRFGGGPMPIVSAQARAGDMPITLIGLGAVTPIATVTVQSQVSGQITQVLFREGQNVRPGDPLFQIDPRPFQVALDQAEGALARDTALLANARTDLERYTTLFAQDSIAEQTLATQKSLVVQDEGTVKTDRAAVNTARLNLSYAHVVSPIAGRAGLQQVNLGNYITPAEPNGLVVIAQLKPITVTFSLPEDQIPPLLQQLHAGRTLPVTAWDRTHTTQLASGVLQSIDSQIDPTTGTLKMKASFANEEETLFPQQFVNIALLLDTLHNATLVPQAAVQRGAPGTYVYVVNGDTVSVRKVTLGPGNATDISIEEGLKPGESVVVDGADKLKDGAKVLVRAAPGPGAAGAPPAPDATHAGRADGQRRHRKGPTPPAGAPPARQ
ncbi:MAG: MdtA/MuxA family multidrug efflux RND transporter periplasmic adaptor subunit [Proteobacteria bacterium]|nr:MdtA/MuxA family multidrug efflux RND transporter periplasmic adaptor subunit [Pseudomonadota bacterium]